METPIVVSVDRILCEANRAITKEQQAGLNASIAARVKAGLPPLIVPLALQKIADNPAFDYKIADGRCRYAGLVANNVTEITMGGLEPSAVLVSGDPDIIAFQANEERVDFSLAEQLAQLQKLIQKQTTLEELADVMGRSPTWIARRVQLLKLTKGWRSAIKQNEFPRLTTAHLEVISKFNIAQQNSIMSCLRGDQGDEFCKQSSAKFEKELLKKFTIVLKDLPWDESGCGKCPACLERLNGGYLFCDMNQAVCMDREYIETRRREYIARQVTEHPDAVLVSSEYYKPKKQADEPDNPLNSAEIIEQRYWSRSKDVENSKTAIIADGPEAGKIINVTISPSYCPPAEEGEKVKSLEERKAAKRKRRERWAIDKLIAFIAAPDCPVPQRDVLMVLVACKGARSAAALRYPASKEMDFKLKNLHDSVLDYSSLEKREDLDAIIWHALKPLIITELKAGQSGPVPARAREALLVSELLQFDLKAALKQSIIELPDPACWAREEAKLEAQKTNDKSKGHNLPGAA